MKAAVIRPDSHGGYCRRQAGCPEADRFRGSVGGGQIGHGGHGRRQAGPRPGEARP